MTDQAAADPTIAEKRAHAQSVLSQIQEMDGQLGSAIEAWNGANLRLAKVEADLTSNARQLGIATRSLAASRRHLEERLVAIYVNGSEATAMEVLLGAESLDDLLTSIEAVARVSEQDARVLGQVKEFKGQVQTRKAKLVAARKAQKREVADLAARRASIETQLRERERLLASIQDQIASLEAAEARRQERLAAEARRRVAALAQQRSAAAAESVEVPAPVVQSPLVDASGESPDAPAAAAEATTEVLAPAPPARYGGVVGIAMQYLGTPYRWGGADPSGFDCSGFTMYVYAKVGVSLPHHAATQYGMGTPVSKSALQPGDLVFFNGLGHMGMYVGGGNFIHSPRTGDVVKISSLNDSWYASTWVGARRL